MKKNTKRITALIILVIAGIVGFAVMGGFLSTPKEKEMLFDGLDASKISKINLIINNSRTSLINKKGSFFVKQGKDLFPADKQAVKDIVSIFANLSKDDIASSNKEKYEKFEVDGKNKVEVELVDNKTMSFYPGKKQSYSRSYFRLPKDPVVYIASVDFSPMLMAGDFRDLSPHIINNENDVREVVIKRGRVNVNLKLKDTDWFIGKGMVNNERVKMYISQLKNYVGSNIQLKKQNNQWSLVEAMVLEVKEKGEKREFVLQKRDKDNYYLTSKDSKYVYIVHKPMFEALYKDSAFFLDASNK